MKIGKLMIGVLVLAIAALLLIGLIKFASVFGFLMFYPYVIQQVAGYGLNPYLAQAIGLLVGAGLWFVVIKLFFVWKEKKRLLGFGILIGFYALHLMIMFLIPGGALVHPLTGERQFCSVDKLTGRIERFETAQFDRFGEKAKECTLDQIEKFEREKAFAEGENLEVPIGTVRQGFISPVTGASLFYYCEDASNAPHFYVASGYCPWGGQLQAVSKEVLQKYASIKSGVVQISTPPPSPTSLVKVETAREKDSAGINFWSFRERSETEVLFWILCLLCACGIMAILPGLLGHGNIASLIIFVGCVVLGFLTSALFANGALVLYDWGVPGLMVYVLTIVVFSGTGVGFGMFLNKHFDVH